MPNFPDISDGNPFLMARMDEAVIDAFEYGTEVLYTNMYDTYKDILL